MDNGIKQEKKKKMRIKSFVSHDVDVNGVSRVLLHGQHDCKTNNRDIMFVEHEYPIVNMITSRCPREIKRNQFSLSCVTQDTCHFGLKHA